MRTEYIGKIRRWIGRAVRLAGKSGLNAMPTFPPDFSADVIETVTTVLPFTMTSPERLFALITAVEYVTEFNVPGDIVECGVWKGGSMMAAALALMRLQRTEKDFYLFDTFEGMPRATDVDRSYKGESAVELMAKADRDSAWVWAYAQLDEVRKNMQATGYPMQQVKLIKGLVEDTVPSNAPQEISLLRIDTDWYGSTRHEMEHLFPRLSPGGVLIVDDYGHWAGARKAVDEYVKANNVRILLCRIDYTGRVAIKQPSGRRAEC
jgi:hypothetical protein